MEIMRYTGGTSHYFARFGVSCKVFRDSVKFVVMLFVLVNLRGRDIRCDNFRSKL